MKFLIVFVALFAVALAAPGNLDADAQIVKADSDVKPNGFTYETETSNGISEKAAGQLKNEGTDDEALEVKGEFSYVAPDGSNIHLTYVADENGFQPQGAHLPVAPVA